MLKALHANGRTSGRAHGRHVAASAATRRSSVLRVALALLVAACCLRLAAEAWQRSGTRSYLLSAVSVRRARRLSLDSAMFYGIDMPTAPLDAVLTSDVIYGMLRLQYGRDSIPTVDVRARSVLEFPGVAAVHTTNTSAFERLLVASVQLDLQEDLCVFHALQMERLTHAEVGRRGSGADPIQGEAAVAAAAGHVQAAGIAGIDVAEQPQQHDVVQQQPQAQQPLANPIHESQNPAQATSGAQQEQQASDAVVQPLLDERGQRLDSEHDPGVQQQQEQPQLQQQQEPLQGALTQQQQPHSDLLRQQYLSHEAASQAAAEQPAQRGAAALEQVQQPQPQRASDSDQGARDAWSNFEEDEDAELEAEEAVQAAALAEAEAEANGGGADAAGVTGDNTWAGAGSLSGSRSSTSGVGDTVTTFADAAKSGDAAGAAADAAADVAADMALDAADGDAASTDAAGFVTAAAAAADTSGVAAEQSDLHSLPDLVQQAEPRIGAAHLKRRLRPRELGAQQQPAGLDSVPEAESDLDPRLDTWQEQQWRLDPRQQQGQAHPGLLQRHQQPEQYWASHPQAGGLQDADLLEEAALQQQVQQEALAQQEQHSLAALQPGGLQDPDQLEEAALQQELQQEALARQEQHAARQQAAADLQAEEAEEEDEEDEADLQQEVQQETLAQQEQHAARQQAAADMQAAEAEEEDEEDEAALQQEVQQETLAQQVATAENGQQASQQQATVAAGDVANGLSLPADDGSAAAEALQRRAHRQRSLLEARPPAMEEQVRRDCRMRVAGSRKQEEADQLAEPLPPPVSRDAALAGSRTCRLFADDPHLQRQQRRPHPTIALVGNAPLNESARPAIAAADFIVRFNWMHHRLPGERVHLWVLTHHPGSPERWGGFDDLDAEELAEVLGQQPTLLFLGGPPEDVQFALDRHQANISRYTRVLHAPTEAYMQAFAAAFRRVKSTTGERVPTSGFTLAMLAVACTPPGTRLHVYGYNWSPRQAERHPMWSEHAVMKAMQAKGWMALHFSPCAALRSCGRIDEHWCRARNDTCAFPQFAQADMMGAVQQRMDLKRLVRLMYPSGSSIGSGGKSSVGPGGGSSGGAGSRRRSGIGSVGSSGGPGSGGSGSSDPGGHPAAEWRAAVNRPKPQQGQMGHAAAASLVEAAQHPFCAALSGSGVSGPPKTVALVGNGPLSIDDRAAIASADRVVRMNQLNNWYPDERLDVWVARHAARPPAEFYGFDVQESAMAPDEVQPAVEAAEQIVLWGGNTTAVHSLLRHYPDLPADKLLHVGSEAFMTRYDQLYRAAVPVPPSFTKRFAVSPTTGFAVMLALLACLPGEAQLHLYGFNWSPQHWDRHDAATEARAVAGFAAAGMLHLHPTPCDGLRSCVRKADPTCRVTRPACWVAPTAYLRDAVYALQGELRSRGLAPAHQDSEDRKAEAAAATEALQYPDSLPHLCRRLRVANASRIAIVGSTLLSAAERRAVRAATTVIRFDGVDRRLVASRRDMVWVVSFRPGAAGGSGSFEGLDISPPADVRGAVASTSALVFWGGLHHNIKAAMDKHGLVLERKPEVARVVADDLAPAIRLLRRTLQPPKPTDVPRKKMHTTSAHFGVLLSALGCSPEARVQLLGFAGDAQAALMSRAEHAIVAKLVRRGFVQIFDPLKTEQ